MQVKTPQFRGLTPTSEAASATMRANRPRDTSPEILLRKALWKRGYRYRLHDSSLPGTPDLVFLKQKLVVFCDGDFWHGRNWEKRRQKLERGSNADYWVAKVESNRRRDRSNDSLLRQQGWKVVRVWEGDVKADAESVADYLEGILAAD